MLSRYIARFAIFEYLELVVNLYIAGKIVVLMLMVDTGNITIKHIFVSVMYFIHLLFLCGLVVSSIFLIEHFHNFFRIILLSL